MSRPPSWRSHDAAPTARSTGFQHRPGRHARRCLHDPVVRVALFPVPSRFQWRCSLGCDSHNHDNSPRHPDDSSRHHDDARRDNGCACSSDNGPGVPCGPSGPSPVRGSALNVYIPAEPDFGQERIELRAGDKISVQLSDIGGLTDQVPLSHRGSRQTRPARYRCQLVVMTGDVVLER